MSKPVLKLDWCSHEAAKYACEKWHYSGRVPTSKSARIGVWEKVVTKLFEAYASETPGAFVERKEWSIAWHYRNAPPFYAQKNLVILKKLLKPLAEREKLGIVDGNMALEVHHLDVSKGHITQEWLLHDQDFILAVGDDTTDEDMFAALPTASYTIKVGRGPTKANYRLPNPSAVHQLLRKL
jgi:trehalose 6-phosphate synthase/phosphatase